MLSIPIICMFSGIAWTMMHEDELRANYALMCEGQLPFHIEPLH